VSVSGRESTRRQESRGRICQWEHCRVDDKYHVASWNAPQNICPSCCKQIERLGPCSWCGGPRYHRRYNKVLLYCPTCEPLEPSHTEISVTLVCSATGRERSIVRNKGWVPDYDGFAVVDVHPKSWARKRV